MRLPEVTVKRPVFAIVVSAVLVIFGLLSYRELQVREYPDVDRPSISVRTVYRGASAEIIETQVTQVLEDELAGISGIKRMNSTSRAESSSINVEFNVDRDIEAAANDVRDRVARAINRLPDEIEPPRIAKSESDARPILWYGLTSDHLDQIELTDYAERFIVDRLAVVEGVARVIVGGARRQAMRIWLDKTKMAARGLTTEDIEEAIEEQNIELPTGRIESSMREFAVRTEGTLKTPEAFARIVVGDGEGYPIRLGEVARIEIGPENKRTELRSNGRPTVGLGVVRQSKANTLAVAHGVKDVIADIRESLPEGIYIEDSYDKSVFIEKSIEEVFRAIAVAMTLVIAVIFVFLRSFRATFIPAIAIPVSIIASFTVLAALDYSINVLTLLALVLAIGLVVDDAIVVLENVHRRIETGEPPLLAAVRGTKQIAFAVIATTVVLVAVFLPISFMPGTTGRLFREFGVSVSTAVITSSFVALSLTPMLCSKLLVEHHKEGYFIRITDKFFVGLAGGYRWILAHALRMPIVIAAIAVGFSAIAFSLYRALPQELSPSEDRGVFFISLTAPEGASMAFTRRYLLEVEEALEPLRADGVLSRTISILAPSWSRPGSVNNAFVIVRLVSWEDRTVTQQQVIEQLQPVLRDIPGAKAFAFSRGGLGSRAWGAPVQVVLGGPSYEQLEDWADRVLEVASANPNLHNVEKNYEETMPELLVEIDRERAADLGVSVEAIGRTLETFLGERRVSTFSRGGDLYEVILRGAPEHRSTPEDLSDIYVRSDTTDREIPLENLIKLRVGAKAADLTRVDRMRAITINASVFEGYTLAAAADYFEDLARRELPAEARISYSGQLLEFLESSSALNFTFFAALLVVFLALAAQFESFIHPSVIMVSVPLAVTGAFGAMILYGLTMNVYSQIGLIMLIGLTAKNSILIVEFANQLRDGGQDIRSAVLSASAIRLRPILMTTISTALGAMPLALAAGAGAEARSTLGIVIIGGITFSTLLSLFVVPVLYQLLAPFTKPTGHIERLLSTLEDREVAAKRDFGAPAE